MTELADEDYEAAKERGRIALATTPRAAAARYDRQLDRIVVQLVNGCSFLFPPRLVQGLENASDEEIGRVEILGDGFGLHWEESDVDVTVAGLMAGRFGTRRYMAERFGPEWEAQAAE
jgi:hypothetical protein